MVIFYKPRILILKPQILFFKTMNYDLVLYFFKDCCKALTTHLSTHSINVTMFTSRYLFFSITLFLTFLNAFLNALKQVTLV